MAFVDEARIKAVAGAGGDGVVGFHHEPYKPKGGPDGGNGGDGGSVILRADASIGTFLELSAHPHVKAGRGGHGEGGKRSGSRGQDRIVLVPPGTVVHAADGVLMADLAAAGDEFVAARGGKGGLGNAHFATATRRSPGFADKGEPGEERWLSLELRLLADVGLIGFPNAGKSTLIAQVSSARPKIADYPFTTLTPNLGVVEGADHSFVIADIPGLIEGAHEGRGLGHRFLRHVRRAAVLAYVVDLAAEDRDPFEDVTILQEELARFDDELANRPTLIVANKVDLVPERVSTLAARLPEAISISALTGQGVPDLIDTMRREVERARSELPPAVGFVRHVIKEDPIRIEREGDAWRVWGRRPERAVATTDMDNEEAVIRLQRHLIGIGVERMLAGAGARTGDEVRIGAIAFDFQPDAEPVAD
ncbi:MAG: GTPase [Actinomycetota bacterium]|jgi:GTP-binding protein|nr:GTPase [Actinomycetota bacterium]